MGKSSEKSEVNLLLQQKQPSPWMIIAIAQNMIWIFFLPTICRRYWFQIFGPLSFELSELVLASASIWVFTAGCICMFPIYYMELPFFEQYKIQKDRSWPWLSKSQEELDAFWKLTRRSIYYTFVNLCILVPILIFLKNKMADFVGLSPTSYSTEEGEWPSTFEMLWQNIVMTLIHELGFYLIHKWCHTNPFLYKFHKVHHEYKMNTVLATQHNHPIDFILVIATPAILPLVIVQPHSFTQFQWSIWVFWANLDDHFGYAFPWSPVRWFPAAALTVEHDFHHSKNLGCFGSKLGIFNKLFGGHDHYQMWLSKQQH